MDNPYSALGVDAKATQDEIKTAYRKLAKKFHPDLNPGKKSAENEFKKISAAYDLIGNADDRKKFDQAGIDAEAARHSSRNSRGPFYSDTQENGGRYSNAFDGMDDDVFSSIFSQMGRQSRAKRASQDELYELNIEFKDSVLGGEQEITLPNDKKFRVKIPAGVESGIKLRFKGKGEPAAPGIPPGDVYVQLNVKPSKLFKRVGKDLETELTISLSDAILGASVKVPTIDGSIEMTVPAGVSNGQKLRAKGKGVLDPATQLRGDQIVTLKIKMPEKVDSEFKKAVEEWAKRSLVERV